MVRLLFVLATFMCSILILNAQSQNWTWVKGDSIPNQNGAYTPPVQQLANPGSRSNATTWTDHNGNLWLFGGLGYDQTGLVGNTNDLWKYDPETNVWHWINGSTAINQIGNYGSQGSFSSGSYPGARTDAISWVDPSGNLWLYGGAGNVNGFAVTFSDLWCYHPATNQWAWMRGTSNEPANYGNIMVQQPANHPGERMNSTSWTDQAGNLWLFGGSTTFNFKSDLWKYNPSANQWTWMHGSNQDDETGSYGIQGIPDSNNKPGARGTTFCFKDQNNNFWLFGGYGYNAGGGPGLLNDLWKFDPISNQWTWINGTQFLNQPGTYGQLGNGNPGTMPGGRMHVNGWVDSLNNVWLFGGMGYASDMSGQGIERLNDLWKYNPTTNTWTWIKGSSILNNLSTYGDLKIPDTPNTPGARSNYMTWSNNKGLWLFGGLGYPGSNAQDFGFQNDLWRFGDSTLVFSEPSDTENNDPLLFPNVFTPNGDHINDLFQIVGKIPGQYSLTILNRWGNTVYYSENPAQGWDGSSGNSLCEDGVYFWELSWQNTSGQHELQKGFVTLTR